MQVFSLKRRKTKKKCRTKIKLSEDIWIRIDQDCGEEWDNKSNDHWVVRDSSEDFSYAVLRNLSMELPITGTLICRV